MNPSTEAVRRRLVIGVVLVTLLAWILVATLLARGGRPDPPSLRAAATLLDGAWKFRTGDDPHGADPRTDDDWETIDLTAPPGSRDGDVGLPDYVAGWMAHGHPGYAGYAWYRRAVDVPTGADAWDMLGPTRVDDGYELYWNGRLLGGSGTLGPQPRLVGTRPLRFALPADVGGTRGVLAVRAFALSRAGPGGDGGGLRTPPILAPRPIADALHRAQWERTIAGYVVDAVEPLAMLAVVGLALWCRPRSDRAGFLVFACLALALTGVRRLENALVSWTDLIDLTTYSSLARYLWIPAAAAWALAWNRWCRPAWRTIDAAALAIMVVQIAAVATRSAIAASVGRYAAIVLFVVIGARIVRGGTMRGLALATLALTVLAFFGGELLDPLGMPGIWFPFGIGVSRTQYIYAVFVPLLAILIVRTLDGERSPPMSKPAPELRPRQPT